MYVFYLLQYCLLCILLNYESKTEFKNMFISCLHRNMHEHK